MNLDQIKLGYEDVDGDFQEETFSTEDDLKEYLESIYEDQLVKLKEDGSPEDLSMVAYFTQSGYVHSASIEPLDQDEKELSFEDIDFTPPEKKIESKKQKRRRKP